MFLHPRNEAPTPSAALRAVITSLSKHFAETWQHSDRTRQAGADDNGDVFQRSLTIHVPSSGNGLKTTARTQ